MRKDNQITSKLFLEDIRSKDFNKEFEKVFDSNIDTFLSAYEYDELDESPIEMKNRGIMIGFIAETVKAPPQIAYIDLDVSSYPQHIDYLVKQIPTNTAFKKSEDIEIYLTPFTDCRVYYSLYDPQQMDRIIYRYEDLRYELSLNSDSVISRIRVCFAENESNINMRTYYLFDKK